MLPDVRGKRLLQLACSSGDQVLSWANRGAIATGVDISAVAIELARTKAHEAGLDVAFRQADLYALPADLGTFDVVYQSWGVVCWLPDLDRWAGILRERLAPGGEVLVCEHHPVWEVLGVRGENRVEVTVDYFGRHQATLAGYDRAKRPTGYIDGTSFAAFVWPVGDVVMSLVRAGFRLVAFFEAPAPEMYQGLGSGAERLPAVYVVKAVVGGAD